MTQEMKRHAVVVAIVAHHGDSEIASFLNVARSFVFKVRRELETSGGDIAHVAKRKKHSPRSDVIRTTEFIQQVHEVVDEDPSKSMRAIAQQLDVAERTIRRVVKESLRYRSYVMRRGQFMSDMTKKNRVIRGEAPAEQAEAPRRARHAVVLLR